MLECRINRIVWMEFDNFDRSTIGWEIPFEVIGSQDYGMAGALRYWHTGVCY